MNTASAALLIASLLAGCSAAPDATAIEPPTIGEAGAGGTNAPAASPTDADSVESMTASPYPSAAASDEPSPTASSSPDAYVPYDIIEITADGLAVRQGPSTQYDLLGASGRDGALESPYRLSAGERVEVIEGPIVLEDRHWYRVVHTDDQILWTHPDEPGFGIHGWIAVSDPTAEFARLDEPGPECCFFENGIGQGTTPFVPSLSGRGCVDCPYGFGLVVANANPRGTCEVRVVDHTGEVLIDDAIDGWYDFGVWWANAEGGRLTIETPCSWSLEVGRYQG